MTRRWSSNTRDEPVSVVLYPHHETPLAILVSIELTDPEDEWIWLPKSQISYNDDFAMGEPVAFDIPQWLIDKKGLG